MVKGGAALLLALCLATAVLPEGAHAFVRVFGTKFADENCQEIAFVGANTWRMLEAQAGLTGVTVNGQNPVTSLMDNAAALNLTVLRVFATGVTPELPVQVEKDVHNDVALAALDQVVASAADRGLRLILILARNWGTPDSRAEYASWNGQPSPDDFYTSPGARDTYKRHVAFMTKRTNTVNGRVYRDDPTIFAWNLMSVDPNHLVTVGEEGFWSSGSPNAQSNPAPSSNWAGATGQDFTKNHQIKSIDFAGMHAWPDNWNVSTDFIAAWISSHMNAARAMGKPLIMEEFGKNVTNPLDEGVIEMERNPTFRTVMDALRKSLESNDVLRGAMYWMADPVLVDKSSPGWSNYSQDQVFFSSSTMKQIIAPAALEAAQRKGTVPGCTPEVQASQGQNGAGRKLLRMLL